jgi:hypothetical protein
MTRFLPPIPILLLCAAICVVADAALVMLAVMA